MNNRKEYMMEYNKKYYKINKEKIRKNNNLYKKQNHQKILNQRKEYRLKNKQEINLKNNIYKRNREKTDISYKLLKNLRSRLQYAVKSQSAKKQNITNNLLGCSPKELKEHIEKQFSLGMQWSNYGPQGFHIDHIEPCSSFDLNDIKQQEKCFHYTNLQPLWCLDNLKKGKKTIKNKNRR